MFIFELNIDPILGITRTVW